MKLHIPSLFCVIAAIAVIHSSTFGQDTTFTYQGRLDDGASPANGTYDLVSRLFDATSGGSLVAGPGTNVAVLVSNGLFTINLNFGGLTAFPGANRWLELGVRTNGGGAFVILAPRQQLTSTPYAITAGNVTGVLPTGGLSGTYTNPVTLNNSANVLTGNGAGLTGVNAATLGGLNSSNFWRTAGNGGTVSNVNFLGTSDNVPLDVRVNGRRALRLQPNTNSAPTIIGGSSSNFVTSESFGSTIGGGDMNSIQSFPGIASTFATIGGGVSNSIGYFSYNAVIGGGAQNSIESNGYDTFIGGGLQNRIIGLGSYDVISGGMNNTNGPSVITSSIGGGELNVIQSGVEAAVIAGGGRNTISNAYYSVISGGRQNLISGTADYSAILGGWNNTIESGADQSSIGGGNFNVIRRDSTDSVIGGGLENTLESSYATIGGGFDAQIQTNATYATIAGGNGNRILTNASSGTISGGTGNSIQQGAQYSTIGGGTGNQIQTNVQGGTIGAGSVNYLEHDASYATISGGQINTAHSNGLFSAIGGGKANETGGYYATVPGGGGNMALGYFSFAAGKEAQSVHNGTFVWADFNTASVNPFVSTGTNQFLIRAGGGVGIGTTQPNSGLHVKKEPTPPGGSFSLEGTTHSYMTFFPQGVGAGRKAFFGFAGAGATILSLANETANGNIDILPGSGGRVGVGRDSAINMLEVEGNASKTAAGSWLANSDRRIKTSISTVTNALAKLAKVRLVEFNYTQAYREQHPTIEDKRYLNVIAQEFQQVFPDAVKGSGEKLPNGEEILQVDTYPLTIFSAAAIQELNANVQDLKTELTRRDAENAALKARLDRLEKLLTEK